MGAVAGHTDATAHVLNVPSASASYVMAVRALNLQVGLEREQETGEETSVGWATKFFRKLRKA